MAKSENKQDVRPPRIQMTYDVEIGAAIESKELPFVVGVVGDFGGNSKIEQKKLKDRKFVEIDRDSFDVVMEKVEPCAQFQVANKLGQNGSTFSVDLKFTSINDFHPEAVVKQIEPLCKLLEARTKLADLRNKLAGNDKLEDILNDVLNNTEKLAALGQQTNAKKD